MRATTFNPLRHSGALPSDLVAIQGIGGLGHLGVQFAKKFGYRVVAIGRWSDNAALAKKLGADAYIDSAATDPAAELQKLSGASVILATAPSGKAMSALVGGLAVNGTMVVVGASMDPIEVSPNQLLFGKRGIKGWAGGIPTDSLDTLRFAEMTGVRPMIEKYPIANAAEYTQHNPQVADGPASVRELVLHPPAATTVHTVRSFADGDYVAAQTDYNVGGPKVGFDVFRFDADKIVEHWDNLQDKCSAPNPSGRTQLDGPTKVTDFDKTDANKLLMKRYFDDVVLGGQRDKIAQYRSADNFHQHNCDGEDNKSGFQNKTGIFAKPGFVFEYTKVYKILGQGNFVLLMSEGLFDAKPTAFYDLYRIENGRQVEHWDVLETIPLSNQWKNPNGKF